MDAWFKSVEDSITFPLGSFNWKATPAGLVVHDWLPVPLKTVANKECGPAVTPVMLKVVKVVKELLKGDTFCPIVPTDVPSNENAP